MKSMEKWGPKNFCIMTSYLNSPMVDKWYEKQCDLDYRTRLTIYKRTKEKVIDIYACKVYQCNICHSAVKTDDPYFTICPACSNYLMAGLAPYVHADIVTYEKKWLGIHESAILD